MQKSFDFYSDAGHGWVKVPKQLLDTLNIADKITTYSYQRGEFVFLEEDMDASTFIHAFEKQIGVKPKFREHYSDRSKIRGYEHYDGAIMATIFQV